MHVLRHNHEVGWKPWWTGCNIIDMLCVGGVCSLPDKVGADREGGLALFAFSDVGLLNSVVELWRYPSAGACIR